MRMDSLSEVLGRSTLPAEAIGGSPSAPVTDSAGRQVRLRIASAGSVVVGCMCAWGSWMPPSGV
jgi:hypothetical protein